MFVDANTRALQRFGIVTALTPTQHAARLNGCARSLRGPPLRISDGGFVQIGSLLQLAEPHRTPRERDLRHRSQRIGPSPVIASAPVPHRSIGPAIPGHAV